ncbi:MAG: SDR family oxidoreductase [Mycobacteriales bacterium]
MMRAALVTGAASGIGAETVRRLLTDGWNVVATGRSPERLDAFGVEAAAGDALRTVAADTTDPDQTKAAVREALCAYGRLDAIIANAGFTAPGTLADGDPEQWRDMLLTNVLGPAILVQAALAALRDSGGRIVIVGSVAGIRNAPGNMYQVTKWAVRALAENTRLMVTGDGIGVTLVAPGRVATPFWTGQGRGAPPSGPMLAAGTIAESISWALNQPAGVDVNSIVVRPTGQEN